MRPQRNAAENGQGRDGPADQAVASMRPQRNAAENVGYNMQNYLFEMLQ